MGGVENNKSKRMRWRLLIAGCLAVLFTGCFKEVSFETTYVLKPSLQVASGAPVTSLSGVKAYAFGVDTVTWTVASYADALAGVLTKKGSASEKLDTPLATAEPYGVVDTIPNSVNWLKMPLEAPVITVVVVDEVHKLYGYCQHEMGENLPLLYVSIVFMPWKETKLYVAGPWRMVNEFYVQKSSMYVLEPQVQTADGAAVESLAGVKSYAFNVDSTTWRVASYADALAGVLTKKSSATTKHAKPVATGVPYAPAVAVPGSDNWLQMKVDDYASVMVVAVDPTHKLFGYTQQTVVKLEPEQHASLLFQPWQAKGSYESGKWRIVNEFFVKEQPSKSTK